jgi:hypothetical protein
MTTRVKMRFLCKDSNGSILSTLYMIENKVLKCCMESMYNVTCMLCKLCLPSIWDSFVRIQMAIFYLCVIWNHIQCGSCMLCKCFPCSISFWTMLIPFWTYLKLLHKILKGTSMCMMTILWQLRDHAHETCARPIIQCAYRWRKWQVLKSW